MASAAQPAICANPAAPAHDPSALPLLPGLAAPPVADADIPALAARLRRGEQLGLDPAAARRVLAAALPPALRYTSPLSPDGAAALRCVMTLADRAGLDEDDPVIARLLAIRALAPRPGTRLDDRTGCPVTRAMLDALGIVHDSAAALSLGPAGSDATIETWSAPPSASGTAIAVPGGHLWHRNALGLTAPGDHHDIGLAVAGAEALGNALGHSLDSPDTPIELDWQPANAAPMLDADALHEDWQPEIAIHPRLKPHPTPLVQSATLASVRPPAMTWRPRLPARVIDSGLVSDAQFEAIVAAGTAHDRHLPATPAGIVRRTGFLLADGTGAGKTHSLLGIILDNWLHGRRQAIVVLEKRRHLPALLEVWQRFGGRTRDIIEHWDTRADVPLPQRPGILVTTYGTLRDAHRTARPDIAGTDSRDPDTRFPRVDQLAAWAGGEFEGILAFDEAQAMRHAANEDEGGVNSRQGLAGIALQDALPDARVVYASATAFNSVHNLAWAERLGLWGAGTPFDDRRQFMEAFRDASLSQLEQLMLSTKAAGCTLQRCLSFAGVSQQVMPVTLTLTERALFNHVATMWGRLWNALAHCSQACGLPRPDQDAKTGFASRNPAITLVGRYQASRKASIANLLASFKTRAVVADIERQLAEGRSAIVQFQSTYEAQLNRLLDDAVKAEPDNAQPGANLTVTLSPDELRAFAMSLPTVRHHNIGSANKPHYEPVLDPNGEEIPVDEAIALRNSLLHDIGLIEMPLPPLDQLMQAFGTARIAEITGRSRRLVPAHPLGAHHGDHRMTLEDRDENARTADLAAFHAGRKPILVFSTGAGGSSLSYHARPGSGNERPRVHYIVQLGHRADQIIQGMGRSHRSGQVHTPTYMLVTADLPADRLYASRIVGSLMALGALSNGHRHAGSNGLFDEADSLDSIYARAAWKRVKTRLSRPGGINGYTIAALNRDLQMPAQHDVPLAVALNRLAGLGDRRQAMLFDELRAETTAAIESAIAAGTYNNGPETLASANTRIISDRILNIDPVHGAETRVLRLLRETPPTLIPFGDAYLEYRKGKLSGRTTSYFARHRASGQIALLLSRSTGRGLDRMFGTTEVITPTGRADRSTALVEREPWTIATDLDAVERYWTATIAAAPTSTAVFLTVVSGALLPAWNLIQTGNEIDDRIFRIPLTDGTQVIGQPIRPLTWFRFTHALAVDARPADTELDLHLGTLAGDGRLGLASNHNQNPHIVWVDNGEVTLTLKTAAQDELAVVLQAIGHTGPFIPETSFALGSLARPDIVRGNLELVMVPAPATHLGMRAAPTP